MKAKVPDLKNFTFNIDDCMAEAKKRGMNDTLANAVCTDMKQKFESGELKIG
jgi:hypothetical protein